MLFTVGVNSNQNRGNNSDGKKFVNNMVIKKTKKWHTQYDESRYGAMNQTKGGGADTNPVNELVMLLFLCRHGGNISKLRELGK